VSVFLLRKIGETHTKQLLLSGDLVSAEEAREMGLLTFVVPASQLEEQVYAYAQKICRQNSMQSMELTKDLIAHIQDMDLQQGLSYAAERNAYARETLDCRRGIASFLNKEKISW
jgi:methylglutaconyl-CoA hydratase